MKMQSQMVFEFEPNNNNAGEIAQIFMNIPPDWHIQVHTYWGCKVKRIIATKPQEETT